MHSKCIHGTLLRTMATNIKVKRNKNENATSMLRRFSRKVRQASIMQEVRARRYFKRDASKLRKKESALTRILDGKKFGMLYKLGRLPENTRRRN